MAKTSQKGAQFVRNWEGKKLNDKGLHIPYVCPAGMWTVGYGEAICPEDPEHRDFKSRNLTKEQAIAEINAKLAPFKDGITEQQAQIRFQNLLAPREFAVNQSVRVPLTQNQFDALVSFVYNVGVAAFKGSTLLRKLNNRDYAGAADEFLRWNKSGGKALGGLTRRRAAEKAMFLKKE